MSANGRRWTFPTLGPDGIAEWKLCLFVTLGLEPGLSIPHVTGRRISGVLRAGTLCAKNNHDVCSAGRCHYSSITSKACALNGFAFSGSCGLHCASQHSLDPEEGTEIWDSFSSWFESWPCPLLVVLLGHSLPESGLDFLIRIQGLMILSMTFLETDALNACEVHGL